MSLFARRSAGPVEIVSLRGTLDAAVAPSARAEIKAIFDEGRTRLALEMSGIRHIDSSGLSVLVTAMKTARTSGGDVVLVKPTPSVRSLLELTRLHRILEVFEDEDAAVAKLSA